MSTGRGFTWATLLLLAGPAALVGCAHAPARVAGAVPVRSPSIQVLPVPDPTAPASSAAQTFADYAVTADGVTLPNRAATPGAADPKAGITVICAGGYSKKIHHVSVSEMAAVYTVYGISSSDHAAYRIDHLVPVLLGGSNTVPNLWPQPLSKGHATDDKDQLEQVLHVLVCTRHLPLQTARAAISANWWAAYAKYASTPLTSAIPTPAKSLPAKPPAAKPKKSQGKR